MSDSTPAAEPTPEPTAPTGSSPSFDVNKSVETLKAGNPLDLGIIGAGLVAFIASLLPYYTVSVKILGTSSGDSGNAWGSGFLGWFGALLALVAAGVLVTRLLGIKLSLPVATRDLVLGLFAVAALFTLIALFVTPGGGCDDAGIEGLCDAVDIGRGFGYWLALLATLAGTALSFLRRSAD